MSKRKIKEGDIVMANISILAMYYGSMKVSKVTENGYICDGFRGSLFFSEDELNLMKD